jgi:hypothetical protein
VITTKLRSKIDTKRLIRKYEGGRNKALDKAGSMVRQSAKKQMSRRNYRKTPIWKKVGDHDGYPLVSMSFQESKPGKVTSWKPREFLYRKIMYARDDRKGSVVIGPDDKVKNVQLLHEFGGSQPVKLVLIRPSPVDRLYQFKVPGSMLGGRTQGRDARGRYISNQRAYVGMWSASGKRTKGRVVARDPGKAPKAGFMEKGLAAKRAVIVKEFGNRIQGP